jgi:hypothetical protein
LKSEGGGIPRIDIYTSLIEHIIECKKGALPTETLKMALRTVRKKHPRLVLMTIDRRRRITSMMPDDEESVLALKTFLEELHASLCLLTDEGMASSILAKPAMEFLLRDIESYRSSDLLGFLPGFLVKELRAHGLA